LGGGNIGAGKKNERQQKPERKKPVEEKNWKRKAHGK
jgi:hypothetical protein